MMDIIVTFIFYNSLSSLARSKYLPLFSFSLIFTLCSAGKEKSTIRQVLFSFFLVTITMSVISIYLSLSQSRFHFIHMLIVMAITSIIRDVTANMVDGQKIKFVVV